MELWVIWKDNDIWLSLPNITNNEKLKWCMVFKFEGYIEAYRKLQKYEKLRNYYSIIEEGYKIVYYREGEIVKEVERVEKLIDEKTINRIALNYITKMWDIDGTYIFLKDRDGEHKVKDFVLSQVHITPLSRLYH